MRAIPIIQNNCHTETHRKWMFSIEKDPEHLIFLAKSRFGEKVDFGMTVIYVKSIYGNGTNQLMQC